MGIVQYFFVLFTWVAAIEGQCTISVNTGLPEIEPLILRPDEDVATEFRYPNKNGILEFSEGEKIRLVCNGEGNHFANVSNRRAKNDIIAVCDYENRFKVSGVSKEFENLGCNDWPLTEQREIGSCFDSYINYEIGFQIDNEFLKLIEVCHNPTRMSTLYAQFKLAKEISGARKTQPRRQFVQSPEHSVSYDTQYRRSVQIDTIGQILGSRDEGQKYIKRDSTSYLARGHLAANADFIYNSQKRATYYYINQAPQWQRCNAHSWFYLERDIRTFASTTDQDLTVYTGVHGIAQLPDEDNVKQDLYLSIASDGTRSIPVPRFFWKVIYNEETQLGTAFVEINNPWLDAIPRNYKICKKMLKNTRWDSWSSTGHFCSSYTCEVDELRRFVSLPQFTVLGPLV